MSARVDSFLRTASTRVVAPAAVLGFAGCGAVALWGALTPTEGPAVVVVRAAAGHFAALSLIALQAGLGTGLLRAAGWDRALDGPLERAGFGWAVGFQLTTAAWLGLALARALGPASVAAVALLGATIAAALWWTTRAAARTASPPDADREAGDPGDPVVEIALAIFLLVAACVWLWPLLVQTALPNTDWDSALYHLPLADRYLDGRILARDPLYSSHSFPGGVSLQYAALIAIGLESAVIPLNFHVAVFTVLATYLLGRQLAGRPAGLWAAAVAASTHIVWQLGLDPRIDGFLCLFLVLAAIAATRWLASGRDAPYLALMAVSLGAATGTKYTGLFFAGVFTLGVLGWALWRRRAGAPAPGVATFGLCAALLLVPNGYWYASNLVVHRDPVFPMLRGDYYHPPGTRPGTLDTTKRLPMTEALTPYLAALPEDSPILETARIFEQRYAGPATRNLLDPIDLLRRPDEYAVKPNHFASPLLLLALAAPFALRRRDPATRRAGAALLGGALLCWLALGSQTNLLRYAMPVLPWFAAGAGIVIAGASGARLGRLWSAVFGLAIAALLGFQYLAEQSKLAPLQVEAYLESGGDRVPWLERVGYNFTPAMPQVIARIHRERAAGRMREGDTILMIGEGKGRLLGVGYLPDSSWFLQRWLVELVNADLDYDTLEASLAAQGITHILYNRGYYRWVVDHTDTPQTTLAFAMTHLEAFLKGRSRVVFETPGMRLVALRRSAPR